MRKLPRLATLLAVGALALFAASVAFGFDSGGTPAAIGADTITWTGNGASGGVLDTVQCDAANDPFGENQPYMLWILTTDGGSITSDATTPVLHLGGTGSGDYTTTNPSENSAAHFVTPYFTPDSGLTAYADIDVLTTGDGAWILTISHGCPGGGRTAAAGPTVSKGADGSYDDTFTWTLKKDVDQSSVTVLDAGTTNTTGTVKVHYTITDSHSASVDSNVSVKGTITVNNPDGADETLDSITDEIVDGANTHVADCTVDTSGGLTVGAGDTKFDYSCDLGDTLPSGDVFNSVEIKWSDQDVGTDKHLDAGSNSFTTPDPIAFTANEIDDCETLTDSFAGGPQSQLVCASDTNAGSSTFQYDRYLTIPTLGTCQDYSNTATSTTNDTGTVIQASRTVRVCHYRSALTIGYWGNHLAPNKTTGCTGLPSGTGCSSNGPWTNQYLGASICSGCTVGALSSLYTANTFQKAAQVFAANNCSNASTSDANAAGCLAAQLLAAELNVANGANACICSTIAAAKAALTAVKYAGPGSKITLAGSGYTRAQLIALKTTLDNYNNAKGCP